MRKFIILAFFLIGSQLSSFAQADAMFTKYMFNSLVYNPAYAGYYDHMYVSALYRNQWQGIVGAPVTQTLTLHSPLKTDRVGVGFNLINDAIGPTDETRLYGSYSYKIPLGGGSHRLAIGIQGGVSYYRTNLNPNEMLPDPNDPAFMPEGNKVLPNFGAGIMYYNTNFYFGVSAPNLIENDLRSQENIDVLPYAKQYRHYYLATGAAIPLSGNSLIFKPSILVKNVGLFSGLAKDEEFRNVGAPTEFDIDLSLLFYEQFQIGASFRSAIEAFGEGTSSYDSADLWASFLLSNGLRIGAAFDYPLNDINTVTFGAFEVMLGYEFNYQVKKTVTPRYF